MRLPATQNLSDAELFYIIEMASVHRHARMVNRDGGGEESTWHLVHSFDIFRGSHRKRSRQWNL